VKSGLAVYNENYDPNVPYSEEIFWTKPQRVVSFDDPIMILQNVTQQTTTTLFNVTFWMTGRGDTLSLNNEVLFHNNNIHNNNSNNIIVVVIIILIIINNNNIIITIINLQRLLKAFSYRPLK